MGRQLFFKKPLQEAIRAGRKRTTIRRWKTAGLRAGDRTYAPGLGWLRIDAGAVCVNDAALNYLALELPMGGWKESGLGVRHGAAGIRKYTRSQALLVTRFAPKREIHYFPYSARVTKLLDRGVKLWYGRSPRRGPSSQ